MEKGILMTLPAFDDVTEYLSVFSNKISLECSKKNFPIKEIKKEDVTKRKVEKMIKNMNYKMIIFNGHGSPNIIRGHKNEDLIIAGENENLLNDRIIYARSCWTIRGLGEKCVENSKKGCFIGYKIPFMFIIDKTRVANPIKDSKAKIFFDTSNLIIFGLLKGHTVKESNENSKKNMLKEINKNLLKGDKDSQAIAQTLWNNYSGQEAIGNINETLI